MKNLIVLFPEHEYLNFDEKNCNNFINCLNSRYLKKGYNLKVVNYKNSKGFVCANTENSYETNISFEEEKNFYILKNTPGANLKVDFQTLLDKLNIKENDFNVICGFECFNHVNILANLIYRKNKNVIIDSDLTELFTSAIQQKNFSRENYNPDLLITNTINAWSYKGKLPTTLKKKLFERYSNPVWGISKKYLKKLKNNSNEI